MTSSIPPNPWYNGIIYNPDFFTSNTETLTIQYANKTYLRRIGANPTSIATKTTFTGSLELSNLTTATINASTGPLNVSSLGTLTLQSGVNPGITIDSSAIVNIRNTIRSANGTSGGFNLTNRSPNTGNFLINNLCPTSNMLYQQSGTTNSHIFSTNGAGTTNLTLSNTDNISNLPLTVQGNLSLTGTNPTISSTSTISDFVIETASSGSSMVLKSQGVSTLTLNGINITLVASNGLINAGNQIIFRTLGTDANISATTSGTNINIDSNGGQIKIGTVSGNVASFGRQILTTPGADISGAVNITLALPLRQMYFITSTSAITVSLPTNSATYTGSRISFRRTVASANIITFNQTGGASVLMASSSTIAVASISFPGATVFTEFFSNGTNWCQLVG